MKKFLLPLALMSALLVSCVPENGEDNPEHTPDPEYSLSISPSNTEITFGAEGGEQSITVTSMCGEDGTGWELLGESYWASKMNEDLYYQQSAEWCKVTNYSGGNGDGITFVVAPYSNTEEARTVTFTLSCGDKKLELTVTQEAKEYSISVEPAELTFGAEGGEQTVTVTSSEDWHLDGESDWCRFSSYSGQSGDEVSFTVSSFNYDDTDRVCSFMFTCGNREVELKVTQKFDDSPIIQFSNPDFEKAVIIQADINVDNQVSEAEAAYMKELDMSSKELTDLSDIKYFRNLVELNCDNNQLATLDVSNNTALERLYCDYNQLTSVDLSNNTALKELTFYDNQLTSLDISKNIALTELYCGRNQLTSLDVSNNTALEYLNCYNNEQLTSLDASGCTALTELTCKVCQLMTLDVSGCTALNYLGCDSNQITTLNLSGCTELSFLYCSWNQLTVIDARDCESMADIVCHGNPLERIILHKNSRFYDFISDIIEEYGDIITYVD